MTFGGQIGFSEILPGRSAKILPSRKACKKLEKYQFSRIIAAFVDRMMFCSGLTECPPDNAVHNMDGVP
jgi:hypothetical protein